MLTKIALPIVHAVWMVYLVFVILSQYSELKVLRGEEAAVITVDQTDQLEEFKQMIEGLESQLTRLQNENIELSQMLAQEVAKKPSSLPSDTAEIARLNQQLEKQKAALAQLRKANVDWRNKFTTLQKKWAENQRVEKAIDSKPAEAASSEEQDGPVVIRRSKPTE